MRGSDIEPVFTSLNALVYQHSLQALSLPHRLLLAEAPVEPKNADKLLQSLAGLVPDHGKGVAFMVLYLGKLSVVQNFPLKYLLCNEQLSGLLILSICMIHHGPFSVS